jgi:hypothetical protein
MNDVRCLQSRGLYAHTWRHRMFSDHHVQIIWFLSHDPALVLTLAHIHQTDGMVLQQDPKKVANSPKVNEVLRPSDGIYLTEIIVHLPIFKFLSERWHLTVTRKKKFDRIDVIVNSRLDRRLEQV